jgi:adenosylmethionine-8-amino-7-oxononanoate aminotransferase
LGCEIVETYAAKLVAFAPSHIVSTVLFSSGSDAVEAAFKLALQYHWLRGKKQKTKIIGREGSYHGNTFAGLAAGGFMRRRSPYEGALRQVKKAAPAHCQRCVFELRPEACALECVLSLEQAILSEGPDSVAAFVAEPVVGAALSGVAPDPRYFAGVKEICGRYEVLFIADEIMSGMGRTGRPFAIEHWGVRPDLIIAGKAISGGYFPLSAVLVGDRVADLFKTTGQMFQNGQTHVCSPIASAVGLHILKRILEEQLVANAEQRGQRLLSEIRKVLQGPGIGEVRGLGLMIGVELIDSDAESPTLTSGLSEVFARLGMEEGILVYPSSGSSGTELGDHLLLLPPLNVSDDDLDVLIQALAKTMSRFTAVAASGRSQL